jgi:outer membrane lipoprotein-sorting protein
VHESTRTRTLNRIAEEAIPDTVDLWPAIRSRVDTASKPRPAGPAPVWMPARGSRRLLGGLASAAVLALALSGAVIWSSQPEAVSAETILDRAQATVAAPTTVTTYHLQMTRQRPERDNETVTTEIWFGGPDRQRSVHRTTSSNGATLATSEVVFRGAETWIAANESGRQWVAHTVGTAWSKPGADASGQASLADVLARYANGKQCMTARQDGEATVAGRSAYLIVATPATEGCAADPDTRVQSRDGKVEPDPKGLRLGEMRAWVDKQTFLPLRTEMRNPSGALMERSEVTMVEYSVSLPDSMFAYTPPPGVTVMELSGPPDEVKQTIFERTTGTTPPSKKP